MIVLWRYTQTECYFNKYMDFSARCLFSKRSLATLLQPSKGKFYHGVSSQEEIYTGDPHLVFYSIQQLISLYNNEWVCLQYLQINPLTLHSEDHLCDFQHLGQLAFPAVHLLLKGFDKPRSLHRGQNNLVVLQGLENLLCAPERDREGWLNISADERF